MITEGTYPLVTRGMSTWCYHLITGLPDHRMEVVTLASAGRPVSVWESRPNAWVRFHRIWGPAPLAGGGGRGHRRAVRNVLAKLWRGVAQVALHHPDGDARVEIDTDYGRRPHADRLEDRARWVDEHGIGGVMLDQCPERPGALSRLCRRWQASPDSMVVANPGRPVPRAWASAADVVCVFEGEAGRWPSARELVATCEVPHAQWWVILHTAEPKHAPRLTTEVAHVASHRYVTAARLPHPFDGALDLCVERSRGAGDALAITRSTPMGAS